MLAMTEQTAQCNMCLSPVQFGYGQLGTSWSPLWSLFESACEHQSHGASRESRRWSLVAITAPT